MWLLAGLGNPGPRYADHRHNIGFQLIDALAEAYQFPAFTTKHHALVSKGRIEQSDCLLCKPQTYMNESGRAVQAASRFFSIPTDQILVLHDELDLPFGKIKLKQGGGHGGHNGLKSIDAHCGNNYWRLRFGIGHPGHKDAVTGYVLHPFSKEEQQRVATGLENIIRHLPLFFTDSANVFMTQLSQSVKNS